VSRLSVSRGSVVTTTSTAAPTSGAGSTTGAGLAGHPLRSRSAGALVGRQLAVLLPALLVVMAAPLVVPAEWVTAGVYAGIYALTAIGLSMLVGTAGRVSVGQAAFFALGGYAAALLIMRQSWPQWAAVGGGVVVGALGAALVGIVLLRLSGHYLTLATLMTSVIVAVLANEWEFTGGNSGIYGIPRPILGQYGLFLSRDFYWLVWPIVFVVGWVMSNTLTGRSGRALAAARDSQVAAGTFGVKADLLRWQLFVLSGALGGLSGAVYVTWIGIVTPQAAGALFSVQFLLMAVIGGGTVWGAVVGAVFVQALDQALLVLVPLVMPTASGEYQLIGLGIVLILVMRYAPGGIAGLATAALGRLRTSRSQNREAEEVPLSTPPPSATATALASAPVSDGPQPGRADEAERADALLELLDVARSFGGLKAVSDVSLDLRPREILGLIGPNGAGKTTLFNIVSGLVPADSGVVRIAGRDVTNRGPRVLAECGAARTFQNLQLFTSLTVLENVMVGCHVRGKAGLLSAALVVPRLREDDRLEHRAREVLRGLGLEGDADRLPGELSFGRQRLVEVARAMGPQPALLLLDEPMAGLSQTERRELAGVLAGIRESGTAILLVEHDVHAVMSLSDRVAVLDQGRVIAVGLPQDVAADRAVISAYLGTDPKGTTE
jgi:branched-chain amino acid transport system permease protein